MRSLSFTRSSPASRNSVTPSANAAATASTGISSITHGISAPSTVVACNGAARTRSSPTGSPSRSPVVDHLDRRAHAHAARRRTRSAPGCSATSSTTRSDPGVMVAATTQNAADDGSPGTSKSNGPRRAGGDPHRALVDPGDRRAERGEHPLGVVTAGRAVRRSRWCRRPAARRGRARSSPARSPPSAGGCAPTRPPPRTMSGGSVPSARPSTLRTHGPQRLDDPAHRSSHQRVVAGQHAEERVARRAGRSAGGWWCPSCRSRRRPSVR